MDNICCPIPKNDLQMNFLIKYCYDADFIIVLCHLTLLTMPSNFFNKLPGQIYDIYHFRSHNPTNSLQAGHYNRLNFSFFTMRIHQMITTLRSDIFLAATLNAGCFFLHYFWSDCAAAAADKPTFFVNWEHRSVSNGC